MGRRIGLLPRLLSAVDLQVDRLLDLLLVVLMVAEVTESDMVHTHCIFGVLFRCIARVAVQDTGYYSLEQVYYVSFFLYKKKP